MSIDVEKVKEIIDNYSIDEKMFDDLLSTMNITAYDFISYNFDISHDTDLSGTMLKGQWSPVLFSLYKNNLNLNQILLPYIDMDTVLGNIKNKNTQSGYSKLSMENILFSGNFYNNFPKESIKQFLSFINRLDKDLNKLKSKRSSYLGTLKSTGFTDYVLPVLLKNNSTMIIESIIFPLLHNYIATTEKIMQYGNVEHIKLWLELTEKNKKQFINIVNMNAVYKDAKKILPLIQNNTEHKEILLDMLTPENIFKMMVSSTKESEQNNINKIKFILSLFPDNVRDNFIQSFYEKANNLNADNMDSVLVNKNTPVAYAILKNMDKSLDYFLSLGYELNNIERDYLSGKKHSAETVNDYEKIVSIVSSSGKKVFKKLDDFLLSLSDYEKQSLLSKLHNVSLEKEKEIKSFYSLKETKKKMKEESSKASLSTGFILNGDKDLLITLLNHGYKLTAKEYSLSYLTFSKWLENTTPKEDVPLGKSFTIARFLKEYPSDYKKSLLLNVVKSITYKSIKTNDIRLELNDLLPVINYLLKDDYIILPDNTIPLKLSLNDYKNLTDDCLYPLVLTLFNNTNFKENLKSQENFLSKVCLSNNFTVTHRAERNEYEVNIIKDLLLTYEKSADEKNYIKFKEQLLSRNLNSSVLILLEKLMIENEKNNIEKSLPSDTEVNKKIAIRI